MANDVVNEVVNEVVNSGVYTGVCTGVYTGVYAGYTGMHADTLKHVQGYIQGYMGTDALPIASLARSLADANRKPRKALRGDLRRKGCSVTWRGRAPESPAGGPLSDKYHIMSCYT